MSPLPSQEQHVPHWTDIDWDPSIANRLTNDLRVRYLDYGSGPALVLLHGMAPLNDVAVERCCHPPGRYLYTDFQA